MSDETKQGVSNLSKFLLGSNHSEGIQARSIRPKLLKRKLFNIMCWANAFGTEISSIYNQLTNHVYKSIAEDFNQAVNMIQDSKEFVETAPISL